MKCGNCGSGITADEKFKHQKNGNVHRYVYYTCLKTRNIHCDAVYMNENDIIRQLKTIIDDIDIKALPMKDKIKHEVERYKKFQNMLLENQPKIIIKNIDLRNYAKFVLQEGSIAEQRELIGCLKGEIFVDRKRVYLKRCEKEKRLHLVVIGGLYYLDREFKKKYSGGFNKINIDVDLKLKNNKYMSIVGDFIFEITATSDFAKEIEKIYQNKKLSEATVYLKLKQLLTKPSKTKLTITRSCKKAMVLKKRMAKDFFVPGNFII